MGETLIKGILLHGGFGTRLRPLTHTGPKQLIKVAGKPVSQWALEDLRDSGVRDVAVILGELAPERVVEYYGDGSWLGLRLTYIYQGYPYGLAHAVYLVRDYVGDEPFVVYLGDNLLLGGIKGFVKRFEEEDSDAMILLAKVPNPQRFGVAVFDDRGRLIGLVEKPRKPPSPYALVGIYFFRPPHIFRIIEELKPSWRGELEITDAIQELIRRGFKVSYVFVKGWWKDAGTPQDLLEANRILLDYKYIEPVVKGEVEEGAVIEGRVYIDENVRVERGAVVRGPCFIGKGTIVKANTYIGPYTSIGDNCIIEGVEVENSIILDNVVLRNLKRRIVDSIIGSNSIIESDFNIPRGLRFIVGERTNIRM